MHYSAAAIAFGLILSFIDYLGVIPFKIFYISLGNLFFGEAAIDPNNGISGTDDVFILIFYFF